MSGNVQVHCVHCDKSLYRLRDIRIAAPDSVVCLSDRSSDSFDGRRNDLEFCDWNCVARWALGKADQ
jgi:hypothetical protein